MTAAGTLPSRRRPGGWLRRLVGPGASSRTKPVVATGETDFGPLEAEAVDQALERWVRLQKAESTLVPARRVDTD